MQSTEESKRADNCLTRKIQAFLQEKQLDNLKQEDIEELVYVAGSIGHEQGFQCAIEFLHGFFKELFGL